MSSTLTQHPVFFTMSFGGAKSIDGHKKNKKKQRFYARFGNITVPNSKFPCLKVFFRFVKWKKNNFISLIDTIYIKRTRRQDKTNRKNKIRIKVNFDHNATPGYLQIHFNA